MTRICFIQHGGEVREVDVTPGETVMRAALINDVRGIDAECGGACTCATCHVYVDDEWLEKAGPISETEGEMLDFVEDRRAGSRLACQIVLSDELDGIVVRMPRNQA